LMRCYSLCNRPGQAFYQIAVKRQPPPANSPTLPPGLASHFLHRLPVGSTLTAKPPCGSFTLSDAQAPLLLVAGGIGITPLLAMLEQLFANRDPRPVTLFYAVRNSRALIAKPFLETLQQHHPHFRLFLCFSQPLREDRPGIDCQLTGHLNLALLRQYTTLGNSHLYLCGPSMMMSDLLHALETISFPQEQIHDENFVGGALSRQHLPTASARPAQEITLQPSGRTFLWQPQHASLLEAAEQQQIELAYGCRAGNCGSCEMAVLQGEAEHSPLSFNQPRAGHCLPCIAIPKTAMILQE
ncbi:MAG: 2Fe-2S iron-sulfur cluster binding domain-containing protein, partial [Magnetococcales bacterium]|nr:2Fe-2S iron-sulfur cluster binding domain-containing protein [Magnetococcales bacterium]